MPGLPAGRREALRRLVRDARRRTEAAYEDRLRMFGLRAACSRHHDHSRDCYVIPLDELTLTPKDRGFRQALEMAIRREEVGFSDLPIPEPTRRSVARLARGMAFTLLNRLAALRAMEVRGLVEQTVVRQAAYGGRSLREYRIAQNHSELGPDQVLEQALYKGFAEAGKEIGALFELKGPYGRLLLNPRMLRELLRIFGENITEADWKADDTLGAIYQYYQDETRESFRAGRGGGQRRAADADELAAINCLYTPHRVVRVLVDNSLGRLLLQQQGRLEAAWKRRWSEEELRTPTGDTVAKFCRYLVPITSDTRPQPAKPLRGIRVLDPACGSGHFLIYAFDVLWRAYREAEPDVRPEEHAATILEQNLFGLDIDLRACQLAALGLYLKAKEYAPRFRPRALNVVCADARILDGERRKRFLRRLRSDSSLKQVADHVLTDLRCTAEIGGLLRVREPFEALFRSPREQEPDQALHSQVDAKEARVDGGSPRERTIAEILEALRSLDCEAVERADMGGQLFAADAERSLGVLSLLSQQYDIVLMNPPYNKRQELPPSTRDYLSEWFGRTHQNIYAAFIEQAVDLTKPDGFVGMLTPLAHMYLRQLRPLRTEILGEEAPPEFVLEFGWDILGSAQIQTAGTVLRKPGDGGPEPQRPRTFWDLTPYLDSEAKEVAFVSGLVTLRRSEEPDNRYSVSLAELARVPGSPYAYWAPGGSRQSFRRFPPLDRDNAGTPQAEKVADVKQGLATADDARFTRRWWEVSAEEIGRGRRWVPFVKGEEYARYYHDPSLVVLWETDGEEIRNFRDASGRVRSRPQSKDFYFGEGLTWQRINVNRRVRTRYLPPGCIFADKGPSVFLAELNERATFALLGLLNSSLANLLMLMLTTERGWEVGQVSVLPIASEALTSASLAKVAREIYDLLAAWDTGDETSSRFVQPRLLQVALPLPKRPGTGHPLARNFAWPASDSWQEIVSFTGSVNVSLTNLLAIVGKRRERLNAWISELEATVDREVFRYYELEKESLVILDTLNRRLGVSVRDEERADEGLEEVERLLSYYAKRAIESSPQPLVPLDFRVPGNLFVRVRDLLRADWGEERASHLEDEIDDLLGVSLEDWLTHDYFPFHVRLYRNRPIFWLLWCTSGGRGPRRQVPAFACFVDYRRLTADTLRVVRGHLLVRALSRAKAEAERLEREATELRIAGATRAARLLRGAEQSRANVQKLERFDRALAQLLERREPAELAANTSWRERMVAAVRANGYTPDPDLGVLVNMIPLQQAGILHPAAERVR